MEGWCDLQQVYGELNGFSGCNRFRDHPVLSERFCFSVCRGSHDVRLFCVNLVVRLST